MPERKEVGLFERTWSSMATVPRGENRNKLAFTALLGNEHAQKLPTHSATCRCPLLGICGVQCSL